MMEGWMLCDVRIEFGQNSLTLSGLELYNPSPARKTVTLSYRHIAAVETAFESYDHPTVAVIPCNGRHYWLALGELERGQHACDTAASRTMREGNVRACLEAASQVRRAMERCV